MRFGVHCSLRHGLSGALEEALEKKCEALQIFTRSPRMWKMKPHGAREVADFKKLRAQSGLFPLAVHAPYLPNLATSNPELYDKSVNALIEDLRISDEIGADFLVIHPGSYSEESGAAEGIRKISRALDAALEASRGKCLILLENVAGGGRRLGSAFEEIKAMIDGVKEPGRVCVCLDTAHTFAAGFDVSSPSGTDRMLSTFDKIIGLGKLKMAHMNDSMAPLGSRKDRHQHLGRGHIGAAGFRHLVKRLGPIAEAGILETPKEPESSDKKNLSLLYKWRAESAKEASK
jgi:deoxyribonuclease-4